MSAWFLDSELSTCSNVDELKFNSMQLFNATLNIWKYNYLMGLTLVTVKPTANFNSMSTSATQQLVVGYLVATKFSSAKNLSD